MKKVIFLGLVSMMLLPLLIMGCGNAETTTPGTMPPLNGGEEAKIIDITIDEFNAEKNKTETIELVRPGSLIVRLGSNPSTGYSWGEAEISNTDVITQASRDFVEPQDTGLVGAPGTDVWVFDSLKEGAATIKFIYSRPWESGEQAEFTLTINITVR